MADRKLSHKEGTHASSSLKRSAQRWLGSRSPINTRSGLTPNAFVCLNIDFYLCFF